jgi:hypothetical protein
MSRLRFDLRWRTWLSESRDRVEGQFFPVLGGSRMSATQKQMLNQAEEQGNALSTAWNFGDGESETVNTDELQTTKVTHAFTQPDLRTII